MKVLCIYCCGGMGREIADLSFRVNKWDKTLFVDDNATQKTANDIRIYSFKEVIERYSNEELEFIVAAGEPALREELYNRLEKNGLRCVSIIYPEFASSRFSSIRNGSIIHTGAIITCNVSIGYGCLINKHSVIGHDVNIGDYTVVSPNVTIGGNVNIGRGCYLGSGAIIRNGISIGNYSIIGMGAVVLNDVPANYVMVGNPAKFIRTNDERKVFKK